MRLKFDQYNGIGIIAFALIYAYLGSLTSVAFYNGSVGPQHWTYILAGLLIAFAAYLLFCPSSTNPFDKAVFSQEAMKKDWLNRIPFIIGVIIYAIVLPYIGFLPAMIALMTLSGMLFGASKKIAFLNAVIMSVICYLLFEQLLGISLGRGRIFR